MVDEDNSEYQVNILDWKVTKIRKIISIFEGVTLTRNNLPKMLLLVEMFIHRVAATLL